MPEAGDVLGVEDGAVTIVSDDDDDGETKGGAPMGVGREGEGVGHRGAEFDNSALGVGDDVVFCCEDDDLRRVMVY